MERTKNIVIIGAGPAGLTAAYELVKKMPEAHITVLEESGEIGGISKTVEYRGNRMDLGGHRFFSKSSAVNRFWEEIFPTQDAPAKDEPGFSPKSEGKEAKADPEQTDRVMLNRKRVSRIFFKGAFFDYPLTLNFATLRSMGFVSTLQAGTSYLAACLHKREEKNLEDFYINRFGKRLYSMFFENYTAKLWGRHPRQISASWGAQRVKGLSIMKAVRNAVKKQLHLSEKQVETSLIETFKYPKLGPGSLWEAVADDFAQKGGILLKHACVCGLTQKDGRITEVTYRAEGAEYKLPADYVISSMPICDLIGGMNDVPERVRELAKGLPYRDFMTLGVLVPSLKLKNGKKQSDALVPDCWIYVQDRGVKMGRVQIFNNWSPYLVREPSNSVWVGLEYFAAEGDELWSMPDEAFTRMAVNEMVTVGLIDNPSAVLDTHLVRVKKAYPAYFDTWQHMDEIRQYLMEIPNLYCVGRNGQHRYNNMDHSMLTAMRAAECILSGNTDQTGVWNVNTEQDYHEA